MKILFSFLLGLVPVLLAAQMAPEAAPARGQLSGVVVDELSDLPIEYANIAVFNAEDGTLVTGSITDEKGHFIIQGLKFGQYDVVVKFIGFNERRIEKVTVDRENPILEMGRVVLHPSVESLQGVEIVAEKKAITYRIDKKIVNPSQFMSASSGTAVDILANTPSVTVDVEGNVTLRGSSNFTVLVDGRPTPFTATDALEQVPASQIENIELITNPSAKYDPDGTSGIINIITKKSKLSGVNGVINVDASSIGAYNGDFLLNFRRNNFNFFIGADRSDRKREGTTVGRTDSYNGFETETLLDDTTYYTERDGTATRGRVSNNLKTGLSYNFTDKFMVGLNLTASTGQRNNVSDLNYTAGSSFGEPFKSFTRSSNSSDGSSFSGDLNFEKKFNSEEHLLTGMLYYQTGTSEEPSVNLQKDVDGDFIEGLSSWENDDNENYRLQLDYVLPVGQLFKLEAGYQLRSDDEASVTDRISYNQPSNPRIDPESPNYYESRFLRKIHSAYSTFGGEINRFGYLAGLRAEYTYREIDYYKNDEPIKSVVERMDFFPTLHFSYKLSENDQLMASYSRRIERVRGYYLEPFETWVDAYSVRSGNPNLTPEYINSFEFGYQRDFDKGFVSLESFFRSTEDKIDRLQTRWVDPETGIVSNDIVLRTIDNVGTDYALGIEGMLNITLFKWWMFNLNGSTFNYRIEGSEESGYGNAENQNWSARMSNTFNITKSSRVQFDYMYRGPSVSVQGEREAFAFSNVSFRQEFFKRKLSAVISVQDVFNTAKFEFKSQGDGFSLSRAWDMKSPIVQFQISYKINNFMAKRERGEGGEGGMDMDSM